MEKNKKKTSLNEIFLLIFILVCVFLVLIDMAINVKNENNIQSKGNTSCTPAEVVASIMYPTPFKVTARGEGIFPLNQADQPFMLDEEWL